MTIGSYLVSLVKISSFEAQKKNVNQYLTHVHFYPQILASTNQLS